HRIFVSQQFETFAQESHPATQVVTYLKSHDRAPKPLRAGDVVSLSRDAQVEVLWPPQECSFDSNDTGLVLRLTYAGRSILFPADIQSDAQRELLKHPRNLKSDILIAPHHGSSEITTADFLHAVAPVAIISSNDHTLTRKQKHFERIAAPYRVYRTDRDGAV